MTEIMREEISFIELFSHIGNQTSYITCVGNPALIVYVLGFFISSTCVEHRKKLQSIPFHNTVQYVNAMASLLNCKMFLDLVCFIISTFLIDGAFLKTIVRKVAIAKC
jgi:hypothetical protein